MNRFDKAITEIMGYYDKGEIPTDHQIADIGCKHDVGAMAMACYNEIERRRSLGAKDPSKPMNDPVNLKKEGEK